MAVTSLSLVSALAIAPSWASAEKAVSFSLPQTPCCSNLVNGVDGFDFTPTSNLVVTGLGWYDDGANGLTHDHPVGIYLTATQSLVAPSAVVTTASTLDSATSFRYASVTPFSLSAGITYTLVGYGEGPSFDPYVSDPSGGFTFGPSINFDRLRTSRANGLEFPSIAGEAGLTKDVFLGPNFEYTVAAVPEPQTYVLMMAGFIGVGFVARRRRSNGVARSGTWH